MLRSRIIKKINRAIQAGLSFFIVGLSVLVSLVFITTTAESKSFGNFGGGSKNAEGAQIEVNTMMETVRFVLEHYKLDNGMYPTTEQGLQALVKKPTVPPIPSNWRGPYLGRMPLAPPGRFYKYVYPGARNKDSYDFSVSVYVPESVDTKKDNTTQKESK